MVIRAVLYLPVVYSMYTEKGRFQRSWRHLTDVPCNFTDDTTLLDLSYNFITSVENTPFLGLSRCKVLNLAHNAIATLDEASFSGVKQLNDLLLNHNHLETIKTLTFSELTNLLTLNISSNQIRLIESSAFHGLNKLRILSLQQNSITRLSSGIFSGLRSLRKLFLHTNRITLIDPNAFDDIPPPLELDLVGNPLYCDGLQHCFLREEVDKGMIFWIHCRKPHCLTLFPPKTNIFVHSKNCTFSKKGLGHRFQWGIGFTVS